jgi:hypothetical protein
MVVVPLSKQEERCQEAQSARRAESTAWAPYVAGGALVAGGVLLLAGQRRAGLVMAASGTALVLLDQQETLKRWWDALPDCIDQVQGLLNQVQDAVNEVAIKRDALHRILAR